MFIILVQPSGWHHIGCSLPLVLSIILGSAASAAHGPRDEMSHECQHERDQQQDADAEWLILEDVLDSGHAVLCWGTVCDWLNVEEQAWVADTVTQE